MSTKRSVSLGAKENQTILSLDVGTSSIRVIAFNQQGEPLAQVQEEFTQSFPQPGWVEQDPMEMWKVTKKLLTQITSKLSVKPIALGIANQRETTIVWDKESGKPIYPAIVWQSRQTAEICNTLRDQGLHETFTTKTGLPVDAYFSATKVRWILDFVPGAQRLAEKGKLLFGTVDTWILWNLTNRKSFATDYTNASRTLLYDIFQKEWSPELFQLLNIPMSMAAEVRPSSGYFGEITSIIPELQGIPITGIAGDQQAALFGQGCFKPGVVKNTYGTGCFALMHTGEQPILSKNGLLTTIAWGIGDTVEYALEGSIFVAGSAVQWLRDSLKVIQKASESENLATEISDTQGVYVVPAFVGMGSPYWDQDARGAIFGLTRGSGQREIVRATLESICYQTRDLITIMSQESGYDLPCLRADGGASENNFLMQFQSDILGVSVELPKTPETTALGAAYLAGLAVGVWESIEEIAEKWETGRSYYPKMKKLVRDQAYEGWKRAVKATLSFKR